MGERATEGEQLTTCSVVRNEAGVITDVEDTVTEILGWRPEQIMGSPSTVFIHPDDQAELIEPSGGLAGLAEPGEMLDSPVRGNADDQATDER